MQLVVTGMLNKQIAGELGTAEKTIKVHRGRVMKKLGIVSVAELVRLVETARMAPLSDVRLRSNMAASNAGVVLTCFACSTPKSDLPAGR